MKSLVLSLALAATAAAAVSSPARAEEAPAAPAPAEGEPSTPAPEGVSQPSPDAAPDAQPVDATAAPKVASDGVDHRVSMWRLELGYRGSFVSDAGYAPFSTNGSMSQFSLAASRTLLARGAFSFAPGIAWDHGKSSETARGDATSLGFDRLTVTLEGRAHLGAWGYAFLRAAPGVAVEAAEVDDPSSPAPFTQTRWLFATDVSGGYAWLVFPRSNGGSRAPRLWLQGEGGYGWVASDRLALSPNLPANDAQLTAGIDLGSLSMSGGFFRVGAAMSF